MELGLQMLAEHAPIAPMILEAFHLAYSNPIQQFLLVARS